MSIKIDGIRHYIQKHYNRPLKTPDYYKSIEKNDFFLVNKLNILNRLKSIKNYKNKYESINEIDKLQFGEISSEYENMDYSNEYYMITYNFDKNIKIYDLNDYIFTISTIKAFISVIITNYPIILSNLFDLYEINICFLNMNPHNIIFYNESPLLVHFEDAIDYKSITSDKLMTIIKRKTNLVYFPIEIHLLYHLLEFNTQIVTYDIIEIVGETFLSQSTILSFFPLEYKKKYREITYNLLEKYLNKDISVVIGDFIPFSYTWDNYSLSVIFIHLIGNLLKITELEDTFLNELLIILSKNIHPIPEKREKINYNIVEFENLFKKHFSWNYIDKIDKIPIKQLIDIL